MPIEQKKWAGMLSPPTRRASKHNQVEPERPENPEYRRELNHRQAADPGTHRACQNPRPTGAGTVASLRNATTETSWAFSPASAC
jgi:hypothetical protein